MSEVERCPKTDRPDVGALFNDDALIDGAIASAVREAILAHKQRGESIVVWRDGRFVTIPAAEIELETDDARAT